MYAPPRDNEPRQRWNEELADGVEDDVEALAGFREVVLRVVDHPVGPERSHELEVPGSANRGDVGVEGPGQLDRGRPDGA